MSLLAIIGDRMLVASATNDPKVFDYSSGWDFSTPSTIAIDAYRTGQSLGSSASILGATDDGNGTLLLADNANSVIYQVDEATLSVTGHWSLSFAPMDIAKVVDNATTYFWVTNQGGHQVVQLDTSGVVQQSLGTLNTTGTGNNEFNEPSHLVVNPQNEWFVTDRLNNRIQHRQADGTLIAIWGTPGHAPGELAKPTNLGWLNQKLYITEASTKRVSVYSESGSYVKYFGGEGASEEYVYNDGAGNLSVKSFDVGTLSELTTDRARNRIWTYDDVVGGVKEFQDLDPNTYDVVVELYQDNVKLNYSSEQTLTFGVPQTLDIAYSFVSKSYTVAGQLEAAFASEIANQSVKVFHRLINGDRELAAQLTDSQGKFSVTYNGFEVSYESPEYGAQIELRYTNANAEVIKSGWVTLTEGATTPISLRISGADPISEPLFRRIQKALASYDLLDFDDFTEASYQDLANEHGFAAKDIQHYVKAALFNDRFVTENTNLTKFVVQIFFGMFYQGIAYDWDSFWRQPMDTLWQAFGQSIQDKVVPATSLSAFDWHYTALDNFRITQSLTYQGSPTHLGDLLDAVGLTDTQKAVFAKYADAHPSYADFWDDYASIASNFSAGEENLLRLAIDLSYFTEYNTPLSVTMLNDANLNEPKDLISEEYDDWSAYLTTAGNEVPSIQPNTDPAEVAVKRDEYLRRILDRVVQVYATRKLEAYVADPATNLSLLKPEAVTEYFAAFPASQLGDDTYFQLMAGTLQLNGNPYAPAEPSGSPATLQELQTDLRSLYAAQRLAADNNLKTTSQAYLSEGRTVTEYTRPESSAVASLSAALTQEQALTVVNRAQELSAGARALLPSVYSGFTSLPDFSTIPQPDLSTDAAVAAAAGNQTYCKTNPWEDALSPGAYLVDLLHELSAYAGTSGNTLLDDLLVKRPDLTALTLSEANTLTEMPSIDLVLEVLEELVSSQTPDPDWNTTDTKEALANHPKNLNYAAYDAVATTVFPGATLWNLYNEEARAYLPLLGSSKQRLMQVFPPASGTAAILDLRDELKLPKMAIDWIGGGQTIPLEQWYGLTAAQVTGASPTLTLAEYLAATGESVEAFEGFLESPILNPTEASITWGADCDLASASFPFTEAMLRELVVYRLLKRSGARQQDLDQVLGVLNQAYFDGSALTLLARALRWQLATGQTLDQALALAVEQVNSVPGYYAEHVQNTRVVDSESLRVRLRVNAGGTDLATTTWPLYDSNGDLAQDAAALLGAISGLNYEELTLVLSNRALGLSKTTLDLTVVSRVHQAGLIIRGLNLPAAAYRLWAGGQDWATAQHLVAALQWSEQSHHYAPDVLDWASADYLFSGAENETLHGALSEGATVWLNELRDTLLPFADPDGSTDWTAQRQAALYEWMAQTLGCSTAEAQTLLDQQVQNPKAAPNSATSALSTNTVATLESNTAAPTADTDPQADAWYTLLRLQKFWHVVSSFGLTTEQWTQHLTYEGSTNNGWRELANLPVESVESTLSQADTQEILSVLRFLTWQYRRLGTSTAAYAAYAQAYLATPDLAAAYALLAPATGWDLVDITDLATNFLSLDANSFKTSDWYWSMETAFAEANKLGRATWEIRTMNGLDISVGQSISIKGMAEVRFTTSAWNAKAPAVRNALREQQRDALLAYLVADVTNYNDATDVYQANLIDPEVGICQTTSRMVQAIAAVQLFMQRVKLGLEEHSLSVETLNNWQYLDRYRVWEAGRKMYLYPENWLWPELREHKSEAFEALEERLSEAARDPKEVEKLVATYVRDLAQQVNLNVLAVDTDASGTLHLVARTYKQPYRYYYRQWINQGYWTAWEKLPDEVTGEHFIITQLDGETILVGIDFRRASETEEDSNLSSTVDLYPTVWVKESQNWSSQQRSDIRLARYNMFEGETVETIKQRTRVVYRIEGKYLSQTDSLDDQPRVKIAALRNDMAQHKYGTLAGLSLAGPYADWEADQFLSQYHEGNIGLTSEFRAAIYPVRKYTTHATSTYVGQEVAFDGDAPSQLILQIDDPFQDWYRSSQSYFHAMNGPYRVVIAPRAEITLPSGPIVFKTGQYTYLANLMNHVGEDPGDGRRWLYKISQPEFSQAISRVEQAGVSALFRPTDVTDDFYRQQKSNAAFFDSLTPRWQGIYNLGDTVKPADQFRFDFETPNAYYNWELFYHLPHRMATEYVQQQNYQEALRWLHFIFDPRTQDPSDSTAQRFWKVKPLYEYVETFDGAGLRALVDQREEAFTHLLQAWAEDPFQPYPLADLRIVTYLRATVMLYLDALVGWADQLFRQETRESLNEAAQLYTMGAQLLGPKPQAIAKPTTPATVNSLLSAAQSDAVWESLIDLFHGTSGSGSQTYSSGGVRQLDTVHTLIRLGIPANPKVLEYWDTFADRLWKLRNCQNLDGETRTLALFAPPIDPGLLAKASAAGVNLGALVGSPNATLPHYRFAYMVEKAKELTQQVTQLGNSFLSALEKRDAEALSLLRASQGVRAMKTVRASREYAIDEAKEQILGLEEARITTEQRRDFYGNRKSRSNLEKLSLALTVFSGIETAKAQGFSAISSVLSAIPQNQVGTTGASTEVGGVQLSAVVNAFASGHHAAAGLLSLGANLAGTTASYQRRQEEWDFQRDQASRELVQLERQMASAELRLAMAENELHIHVQNVQNTEEEQEFLETKFAGKTLYDWMVNQLAQVYFEAYRLAYEAARQAEACLNYEQPKRSVSQIQFGYWNSLKKGLLAGEQLMLDLHRLERAYREENKREYELTKHISLKQLNPAELATLRHTGTCTFAVPEVLYDLDHPGHYLRRIKSVSLSLPCVAGPYTTVSAKLSYSGATLRNVADRAEDPVSREGLVQAVATSSGQADAGVFELNFRDERYLPFEGAGAVGSWTLTLPQSVPQFDYQTISDVVLHIQYTARDGGDTVRASVESTLSTQVGQLIAGNNVARLISLKQLFPNAYYGLLEGALQTDGTKEYRTSQITLEAKHLPFWLRKRTFSTVDWTLGVQLKKGAAYDQDLNGDAGFGFTFPAAADGSSALVEASGAVQGRLLETSTTDNTQTVLDTWTLFLADGTSGTLSTLTPDDVEDIYLLVNFTVS